MHRHRRSRIRVRHRPSPRRRWIGPLGHQRPLPRAHPRTPWGLRGRSRRIRGSANSGEWCAATTRRPRRHSIDIRSQNQVQAHPAIAHPRRPSAATTGHPGTSPPQSHPHARRAQSRKDPVKPAASTPTTPTNQTTEDTLSICCSRRISTPPSFATSLPSSSPFQSQWTTRSALSQTRHPQVQRCAQLHATCLIARPSTHLPGLRRQRAQPPPLHTRTAARP